MHRARFWVSIFCIMTIAASLSGCEPLRKKFTRKKKEKKSEEFIPVLDPIDYPAERVSAVEKYSYHYSLWQVWSKDLSQLLNQRNMDKRRDYLCTEIAQQFAEMKRWIPQESLSKLETAEKQFEAVRKELAKPEMVRSQSVLESGIRRAESYMLNNLKPDLIFTEEEQENQ